MDVYDFMDGLLNNYPEEFLFRDGAHITSFAAKCLAIQMATIHEQVKHHIQRFLT